jgi:hypothetical protein
MSFLLQISKRKSQKVKIKKMKKITVLLVCFLLSAAAVMSQSEEPVSRKDTIIISFANGSRLLLLINKKDDIELIKRYDINAIISDLSQEINGLREDEDLVINEEEGDKYLLKPVVVEKSDFQPADESEKTEEENKEKKDYENEGDYDSDDSKNDSYDVRINKKRKFWPRTRQSINIDIGLNNYLEDFKFPDENNKPYSVKPHGSVYFGINTTYKTKLAGPLFVEWGGGFDWYNFNLDNKSIRFVKTDSVVRFDPDPRTDIDPIRSKLNAGYIYLKMVPMLDFSYNSRSRLWNYHGDGFRLGLGGYAGFRITSRTKFVYKMDGDREADKDSSNIFLNNVRYGIRFQVGYRGVDMFLNYDVSPLFSENRGPELNAFSFGFTL